MNLKNKFIFAGNIAFVLNEMINIGLNIVNIFAVKDSCLEKYLKGKGIKYELLNDNFFIEFLISTNFNYLILNGLPYILPILKIKKINKKSGFINIHPSYLPELRGADPQPWSLLFAKDSDLKISFELSNNEIYQKIKAFSNLSQGAYFI